MSFKICHWSFLNGSGLSNMATDLARAEAALGVETLVCNTHDPSTWGPGMDADIHVVHSHIPDALAFKPGTKIVHFMHGSPDHSFEISVIQGTHDGYGAGDSFSIGAFLMRRATVNVTFWEREAKIWQTMTERPVVVVPMGVDRKFWTPQNVAPLSGEPSIFTAENMHSCKWPLDLFFIWPEITRAYPGARLHALNVPYDQLKWWTALSLMNGSHYTTYLNANKLNHEGLRNFFSACHFYYSPVKTGDFNRICLEAKSVGTKVISFEGNEYADYWVREGNQWRQLEDVLAILSGKMQPRTPLPVPDISDTAKATIDIYKEIL